MYLQTLQLTNFKNYESLNLELSPGLNGFVGNNGCGKTNILDAVYYLSMCKSYLNSNDRQNIRFDQSFFSISGNWNISQKMTNVHCAFKIGAKKVIKLNKKEYEKISEHIGRFPLVFISPYDGDLIAEGSEMRRKWMDGILVQLDKNYLEDIVRYSKILDQRNALLKNMFEHRLFDRDSIDIWDVQLIEVGERIHRLHQDQQRQDRHRLARHRQFAAHDDGAVSADHRHQHRACALQRRRARAGGSAGRPYPIDVRQHVITIAHDESGTHACARRHLAQAQRALAGGADHARIRRAH